MVDRIKQVMEHYEETPAGFAEKIGVNRSNLTHLFSGRNQPSLDFAKKVLTAFPEVSTEWLIMGVGNMIKSPEEMNMQPRMEYVQTDLFGSMEEEDTSELEQVVENLTESVPESVTIGNEKGIQEPVEESSLENVKTDEGVVTPSGEVETVEIETIKPTEQPSVTAPESNISNPVVHSSGKSNSRTVEKAAAKSAPTHSTTQPTEKQMTSSVEKPQPRPVARPVEKPVDTPVERPRTVSLERTVTTPVEKPRTVSVERPAAVQTEQAPAHREKKIEKIIFFYDDDSFKVYHP